MVDRRAVILVTSILCAVLVTLAIVLRLLANRIKGIRLGSDDWTILLGWIFSLGLCADGIYDVFHGSAGKHMFDEHGHVLITDETLHISLRTTWIGQWLMVLGPGFTKISVILFYMKIFITPGTPRKNLFKGCCWTILTLSVMWTIAFFFSTLFECHPISYVWTARVTLDENCFNIHHNMFALAISDVVLDALILTLPWIPLSKLNMPLRKKLSVAGMLLLGSVTVIAGICRTIAIYTATRAMTLDWTWVTAPAVYWAVIEACIGVIGACLPCLGPLFRKTGRDGTIKNLQSDRFRSSNNVTRLSKIYGKVNSDVESANNLSGDEEQTSEKRRTEIVKQTTITMTHLQKTSDELRRPHYFGACTS